MCACRKKHCSKHSESKNKPGAPARKSFGSSQAGLSEAEDDLSFIVAIPLLKGVLCSQFDEWEQFAVVAVENGEIEHKDFLTPPFREPEILPRWLETLQVTLVIAGLMNERVHALFARRSIDAIMGIAGLSPEDLIRLYLAGALKTEALICDDLKQDSPRNHPDRDVDKEGF